MINSIYYFFLRWYHTNVTGEAFHILFNIDSLFLGEVLTTIRGDKYLVLSRAIPDGKYFKYIVKTVK